MPLRPYQIFILILIAVMMGGGGFLIGKRLKDKIAAQQVNTVAQADEKTPKEFPVYSEIEPSDYEVTHPDHGPILQTITLNALFGQENDTATAALKDTPNAHKITPDQDVILYDRDGYVLPLGGKVDSVNAVNEENEGNKSAVITLPAGTNTDLLSPKISIITLEIPHAKRIPKQSVLTVTINDVERDFIIIAEKTANGQAFKTAPYEIDLDHMLVGDHFVELGHEISVDDYYIVNPDDTMTFNKPYAMKEIVLNTPSYNPIRQAYLNYQHYLAESKIANQEYLANDCFALGYDPRVGPAGQQSFGACSSNVNATLDPMEIFNSILTNMPVNASGNSGDSACGSASSACN